MKRFSAAALSLLAAAQLSLAPISYAMASEPGQLDAGTRLYLSLDEVVSSARGGDDVGTVLRCKVWRDVEDHGTLFIKAGTPATCRVDKVSRRNIGGFEGKVSVGGVETRSVDGQIVTLSGGYNKEGSGHKAVVLTIGILLLWPVLFVPGGNAELPPGTVFDVSTVNNLKLEGAAASAPPVIHLDGMANGLRADFMVDDFVAQPKHDTFRIKVAKDGDLPSELVIDSVDGKTIDPLKLTVGGVAKTDGTSSGVAEISTKALSKYFVRGINRFDVAYTEDGQRKSTEVVMDVQM
jgi:hypothetical protein